MGRTRTSVIWRISSEEFKSLVERSSSTTEILSYFGLQNKGGNNRTLKRRLEEEGVDVSHFLPNYARMVQRNQEIKKPLLSVMVENSGYDRGRLKRRLLKEGLLKEECAECGQKPEWKGKPLVMVLDHINGVNNDHRLENLRLLCPNCNSQTPTFAGRKTRKRPKSCKSCGKEIVGNGKTGFCGSCVPKERKVERPSLDVLRVEIDELGYVGVGRKYGVSDNAVRKWLK